MRAFIRQMPIWLRPFFVSSFGFEWEPLACVGNLADCVYHAMIGRELEEEVGPNSVDLAGGTLHVRSPAGACSAVAGHGPSCAGELQCGAEPALHAPPRHAHRRDRRSRGRPVFCMRVHVRPARRSLTQTQTHTHTHTHTNWASSLGGRHWPNCMPATHGGPVN